jgi:hypothetical protein
MTWGTRSATIGLSATSILLCLLIDAEISGGPRGNASYPVAARIAPGTRDHLADAPGASDHRAEWLNEIMARPLFSPTRRPVGTTVSGLPRLTGIVVAGSERVAIFAAPGSEHPIVAHSGARVGAYEVQTIGDEGVTVVGPGGTTLIRPIFDVARPAGPAPSGAPVARAQPARPATR